MLTIKILKIVDFLYILKRNINFKKLILSYINTKDINVIKYIKFNKELFISKSEKKNIILIDCFPIPSWIIVNSFFTNKLSEKLNANIVSYDVCQRDIFTNKIYKSFGCNTHLRVRLTKEQSNERNLLFNQIMGSIKTKEELFSLKIDDVWIGLDIYESILALGNSTVNINSFQTKFIIYHSLMYFLFFSELMKAGKVKAVDLSHDCYVRIGLLARIAYRYGVPVYTVNALEISKTMEVHQLYRKFYDYPKIFSLLSPSAKINAISRSKELLHGRLNGVLGIKIQNQLKSAFEFKELPRQTRLSEKKKIVIATHCFFDNPHGLGWMLFVDFYEWLSFLGEISDKTDYDWYIKPHPDFLPGTIETLDAICKKFPNLSLIDPSTSWHQLKDEGVEIALTCYGSIGHELPLLGLKVINAAYNPHIAYEFNWHPKTKDELESLIMNLEDLGSIKDVEKVYEFFYVHKFMVQKDDLFFPSYEDSLKNINNSSSKANCYEYFLKNSELIEDKARITTDKFLKSDATYYYELQMNNG